MPKKLGRQATGSSTTGSVLLPPQATAASMPPSLTDPSLPLPRAIVFDLDYTLWPFWVDTHVTPPLKSNTHHSAAADRFGEEYAFYADVPSILQALPRLPTNADDGGAPGSVALGVASRTHAPSLARELLKMLHLPPLHTDSSSSSTSSTKEEKPRRALDAFEAGLEIYPSSKIRHFEALQKRTGIRFEDMLFFDDEARNRDTETLGVTMWLVRDGVTWDEVDKGVAEWRRRRGYKPN
ncbi:hypothetical protein ACO1O0_008288 [Amphichorda felina]